MPNLTLLLLTKNESQNIIKNFGWIKKFSLINEIIVVDDNSTDSTIDELNKLNSKDLKVKIYNRGLDNDFSGQRQFGVSKSKNDWIFWLDPDEIPSPSLLEFIHNIDLSRNINYSFKRNDIFIGQNLSHGETAHQYFLRLFNRNHGKFTGKVHEIWNSNLPVRHVNLSITHLSHQTLRSFFNKINFYSEIRSQELYENKVTTNFLQIIFFPTAKFLQNYIFYLGFLDGTAGIVFALGMSFHSFLVRAKLWTLLHP